MTSYYPPNPPPSELELVQAELASKCEAIDHLRASLDQALTRAAQLERALKQAEATDAEGIALEAAIALKDSAYGERNKVVALLARMAVALGWRAGIGLHPLSDKAWEPDWRTIVFIDLPTGQATWHFHDSERRLLDGLPAYGEAWDGHSTGEKYRRVSRALAKPSGGEG